MKRKHDLMILLSGEDEKEFPRSKKTVEIFKSGEIGDILVSGSTGGFAETIPSLKEGSHIYIADFLNLRGIPARNIHLDWRSFETLGNFVFPYANPLQGNPDPNHLKTVFLTEWGHMNRAKDCVKKVVVLGQIDYASSPGEYGNQSLINKAITAAYHSGLMKQTRDISYSPQKALKFLESEHPFYRGDWFNTPVLERKLEIVKKIVTWNLF